VQLLLQINLPQKLTAKIWPTQRPGSAAAAQQQHARVTSGQNSVTNYGFLDFRKKLSLVLLFINISF